MTLHASILFLCGSSPTPCDLSILIAKQPSLDVHSVISSIDLLGQSQTLPLSQRSAARQVIGDRLIAMCSETVRVSLVSFDDVRKAMDRFGYGTISPKGKDYSIRIDSFSLFKSLKSDRECLKATLEGVAEFQFDHPQQRIRAKQLIFPEWRRSIYGLEYRWGKYQYVLVLTRQGQRTRICEIIIR